MQLKELLNTVNYTEIINRSGIDVNSTEITNISSHSQHTNKDCVFVCISGSMVDSHDSEYVNVAYNKGCRVFIAQKNVELPDDTFIIIVKDSRIALAELSAAFFGYPASKMTLIGITGTKGKTTSSLLIYNILKSNGIPVGYIGSNGIAYNDVWEDTLNTTPESYFLHEHLNMMYEAGIRTVVMEVSSQALKMSRVHGIKFNIGVFTNLSPDHIGEFEHPDFNDYKECKHSLFTDYGVEYIVYNADDEYSTEMTSGSRAQKVGISGKGDKNASYSANNICYYRTASKIAVNFKCNESLESYDVDLSFPGDFSVYNALTAIAVCKRLGLL
ncbi:MAG: UDP-N-acetylmuramoyl-L-alanyl-D-glutamate--2,6-diaminopimelate ligase, partial [Ruminococcaceae bacterium]|nr:UDP-N-acetylmuramoyl-L-alanyl-D-glutamate--2,6-diaminopimelate ligase [Oscillospiraceae bacterium]